MPAVLLADGWVALMVGNTTYAHIGRLSHLETNAADMSVALRRLGFEVTTQFDVGPVELTEALRTFTWQSPSADVSLVLYASHGIKMDGVNYLVPVDAHLERDVDVGSEAVTVDDLVISTSGASFRLVILDACWNNVLARSIQRTAATRTVASGSFGDLDDDLLRDEPRASPSSACSQDSPGFGFRVLVVWAVDRYPTRVQGTTAAGSTSRMNDAFTFPRHL